MARRRRTAEVEAVDEEVQEDEGAPAGAEFVPEAALKPRSDVYSLILILTFVAFLAGCIIAGREAWEHYDVQFWVFTKDKPRGADEYPPAEAVPPPATEDINAQPAEPPPEGANQ